MNDEHAQCLIHSLTIVQATWKKGHDGLPGSVKIRCKGCGKEERFERRLGQGRDRKTRAHAPPTPVGTTLDPSQNPIKCPSCGRPMRKYKRKETKDLLEEEWGCKMHYGKWGVFVKLFMGKGAPIR